MGVSVVTVLKWTRRLEIFEMATDPFQNRIVLLHLNPINFKTAQF